MKETFVEHNYTREDVAKSTFKKHWTRSVRANQNEEKEKPTRSLLGIGAMAGSAYPYPGVARATYLPSKKEDDKE
jgi:hypothetical protein